MTTAKKPKVEKPAKKKLRRGELRDDQIDRVAGGNTKPNSPIKTNVE
jgi:hypothetical protein